MVFPLATPNISPFYAALWYKLLFFSLNKFYFDIFHWLVKNGPSPAKDISPKCFHIFFFFSLHHIEHLLLLPKLRLCKRINFKDMEENRARLWGQNRIWRYRPTSHLSPSAARAANVLIRTSLMHRDFLAALSTRNFWREGDPIHPPTPLSINRQKQILMNSPLL